MPAESLKWVAGAGRKKHPWEHPLRQAPQNSAAPSLGVPAARLAEMELSCSPGLEERLL